MMSGVFLLAETVQNASGTFDVVKALAVLMAMFVFLKEPVSNKLAVSASNVPLSHP
jgi:hypothetical protein